MARQDFSGIQVVGIIMIVSKLHSGLGNQLFQYAAGRSLALLNHTTVGLDLSDYIHYLDRKYVLDAYNISAKVISSAEKADIFDDNRLFRRLLHMSRWTIYRQEMSSNYSSRFEKLSNNTHLDGYWQSERYFHQYSSQIRLELTLKHSLNLPITSDLSKSNTVSVHVRRGDYVTDPTVRSILRPCPLSYYHKSIHYVRSLVPTAKFYVFSDDISWVKGNFPHDKNIIFVDPDLTMSYRDLELMRLCAHNIIANSSYSWWAAWLNSNPHKIIVAPKRWYSSSLYSDEGIISPDWKQL